MKTAIATGRAAQEKAVLQLVLVLAAMVPILAGLAGAARGPAFVGAPTFLSAYAGGALDSHFRYLSGLLLGVGVGYLSTVRDIERQGQRLFMLTLIVVIGGFCRAWGALINGLPGPVMSAALVMELVVAPAVYLWQARIARLASTDAEG